MWGSMTPLRQFPRVPQDIVRKAESKQFVRLLHLGVLALVGLTVFVLVY